MPTGNRWETIAPGAIAIITDKENPPAEITVQRSFMHKRLHDSILVPEQSIYENAHTRVGVLYEKIPFVKHESVSFAE